MYVIFHGYFHDDFILISKIKETWFSKDLMNLEVFLFNFTSFYRLFKLFFLSFSFLSVFVFSSFAI